MVPNVHSQIVAEPAEKLSGGQGLQLAWPSICAKVLGEQAVQLIP